MKLCLAFLALLYSLTGVKAQTVKDPAAHEVLKAMAKKYASMKSYSANYSHVGESAEGKKDKPQLGKVWVQGAKYRLLVPEAEVICDGKTIWSHVKSAKEVNISDYAPGEEDITPTNIHTIWQKGYKYALMSEMKGKDDKTVQVVDLEPEDREKGDFYKVRLVIDKATRTLKKWVLYERGTGGKQSFTVTAFKPNPVIAPGTFAFDKAKFPGVKVVDLR